MKYHIILLLFAFYIVSFSSCNKQPKVETDSDNSENIIENKKTSNIKKLKKTSEKGFEWYLLQDGDLYGAEDGDGNEIIPIKYDRVKYEEDEYGIHYFVVIKGTAKGVYTREGTLVLPVERNYTDFNLASDMSSTKYYWIAKKENSKSVELTDARGDIVMPMSLGYMHFNIYQDEGPFYINAIIDNSENLDVCDIKSRIYTLDGKIIHVGEHAFWTVDWDYAKVDDCTGEKNTIYFERIPETTKFDYDNFDHLYSPSDDISKQKSKDEEQTNSYETEDQEQNVSAPAPARQQTPCVGCGGSRRCTNCRGKGRIPEYSVHGYMNYRECGTCRGSGICSTCNGTGIDIY